MSKSAWAAPLVCLLILLNASCSMTKLAANQTTAVMIEAVPSYDRESDLEFAE